MAPSPFASSTRQPWRWTNAWSPLAGPRQSSLDLQCSAFCGAGLLLLLSRLLPCHPTPAQGPTSATGSEGTRISGYRPSPFQHLKLLAKAVGDPPFARQAWYSATVMAVRLCALGGQQARPDTGSYCRQVVGGRQYRQLLSTGGGGGPLARDRDWLAQARAGSTAVQRCGPATRWARRHCTRATHTTFPWRMSALATSACPRTGSSVACCCIRHAGECGGRVEGGRGSKMAAAGRWKARSRGCSHTLSLLPPPPPRTHILFLVCGPSTAALPPRLPTSPTPRCQAASPPPRLPTSPTPRCRLPPRHPGSPPHPHLAAWLQVVAGLQRHLLQPGICVHQDGVRGIRVHQHIGRCSFPEQALCRGPKQHGSIWC